MTPDDLRRQLEAEAAERIEVVVAQAARDDAKAEAARRRAEAQVEAHDTASRQGYVGTIGIGDFATGGARATRTRKEER